MCLLLKADGAAMHIPACIQYTVRARTPVGESVVCIRMEIEATPQPRGQTCRGEKLCVCEAATASREEVTDGTAASALAVTTTDPVSVGPSMLWVRPALPLGSGWLG
jgi:hypothetical protein